MKKPMICPHCKQPVVDEDSFNCVFCGEELGMNTGFLGRFQRPKILLPAIAVLVLLGFFLLSVLF